MHETISSQKSISKQVKTTKFATSCHKIYETDEISCRKLARNWIYFIDIESLKVEQVRINFPTFIFQNHKLFRFCSLERYLESLFNIEVCKIAGVKMNIQHVCKITIKFDANIRGWQCYRAKMWIPKMAYGEKVQPI